MEAQLITFPSSPAHGRVAPPAAAPAAPGCRPSEIDVPGVGGRLKLRHFEGRTIIAKIRLLIATAGFPEPRTPRFVKGVRQRGPAAVWAKSRWDRDQVDLWFDDDLPPAAAPACAAATHAATRQRLAENARKLAGVAG